MAVRIINISRAGETNAIKFRDSEGNKGLEITTEVNPEDYVIWEIDPDQRSVYKLFGIESKTDKTLLIYTPVEVNGAYVGKVKDHDVWDGEEEDYTVYYQLEANGPVLSQDPKLKMNK